LHGHIEFLWVLYVFVDFNRKHSTTQIAEGSAHGQLIVEDCKAIRVIHPLQSVLPCVGLEEGDQVIGLNVRLQVIDLFVRQRKSEDEEEKWRDTCNTPGPLRFCGCLSVADGLVRGGEVYSERITLGL
jgi:hypothetical protein